MTQPAKSQEPSMEEILASIRRIIADDDAGKAAQRATEPAKPAAAAATAVARPAAAPMPPSSVADAAPASPEPGALDMGARAADPAAAGSVNLDEPASDILDLTESMTTPSFTQPVSGPAPQFRKIDGYSDVGFAESAQKPPSSPPREAREQLLSSATSAAVDSAFNALAQTVLVQNARTLEDLVREMLRPMLKSWLDDNLPGMVERLVRAEIERVARGR